MRTLDAMLIELADALPDGAGAAGDGVRVEVTAAELTLPLESRFDRNGEVLASAPRGRMATGFDAPLGRLRASFTRGGP